MAESTIELQDTVITVMEMNVIHNRMLYFFNYRYKSEVFRLYSLLVMPKKYFETCLKYKTPPPRPVNIRAICHREIAKTVIEWPPRRVILVWDGWILTGRKR
jgi:hypothetical protein